MRVVLVGIALLAFAGGPSLKDLNVSQPERDVLSGRIIYSTICIRCHGVEGKGDGPSCLSSLSGLWVRGREERDERDWWDRRDWLVWFIWFV